MNQRSVRSRSLIKFFEVCNFDHGPRHRKVHYPGSHPGSLIISVSGRSAMPPNQGDASCPNFNRFRLRRFPPSSGRPARSAATTACCCRNLKRDRPAPAIVHSSAGTAVGFAEWRWRPSPSRPRCSAGSPVNSGRRHKGFCVSPRPPRPFPFREPGQRSVAARFESRTGHSRIILIRRHASPVCR